MRSWLTVRRHTPFCFEGQLAQVCGALGLRCAVGRVAVVRLVDFVVSGCQELEPLTMFGSGGRSLILYPPPGKTVQLQTGRTAVRKFWSKNGLTDGTQGWKRWKEGGEAEGCLWVRGLMRRSWFRRALHNQRFHEFLDWRWRSGKRLPTCVTTQPTVALAASAVTSPESLGL